MLFFFCKFTVFVGNQEKNPNWTSTKRMDPSLRRDDTQQKQLEQHQKNGFLPLQG
jgi:hypothetical protein